MIVRIQGRRALHRTLFSSTPGAATGASDCNPTHLADPTPGPVKRALKELYRSGSGPKRTGAGQPRIVTVVTGGGGTTLAWLLSEPGASSCLLEALVPYDKMSCLDFLGRHGHSADGIGFCSQDMAIR